MKRLCETLNYNIGEKLINLQDGYYDQYWWTGSALVRNLAPIIKQQYGNVYKQQFMNLKGANVSYIAIRANGKSTSGQICMGFIIYKNGSYGSFEVPGANASTTLDVRNADYVFFYCFAEWYYVTVS